MPLLELTLPKGALGQEALQSVVEELTEAVLRWEGAPRGSQVARDLTWVYVDEVTEVHVAGRPSEQPRYRVVITVPEGALSMGAKAGLVKDATEAIVTAEGSNDSDAPFRVWCLINEVPDGNWGALGRIFTFADIAAMVTGRTTPSPTRTE